MKGKILANVDLGRYYKVGHADDRISSFTSVDYGDAEQRNYLDAIELASEWMRQGHKFVLVEDTGVTIIRINEMGINRGETDIDHVHWSEHFKMLKALQAAKKEL